MTKNDFLNILINLDEITTENLLQNDVSSYYISKFVNDNVIKRISRGKYDYFNLDDIYYYGRSLIKFGYYDDAIKCFIKCINKKDNALVYFQLVIANIYNKNYEDVLKYLDILFNLGAISENERRYIIYLISNVTTLSDKYFRELVNMTFDSIKYINVNDKNMYNENRVRGFCFKKKFSLALMNNKNMLKNINVSIYSFIHTLLITQAYENTKNKQKIMYDCIKNKEYFVVKDMLDKEVNPSKYDIYVKKLLEEIICIISQNKFSKTLMVEANDVFEAIDGKNFSLALYLSDKYEKTNYTSYNLINLLLCDICSKIKENKKDIQSSKKCSLSYFTEINENNYYEVERLMSYINKILTKKHGVYILDNFNEKTTNDLLQIIKLYPNLDAFIINYNLEKRIVVKYSPICKDDINVKKSYMYALYYYQYREYENCLNMCLDLLQIDNPSVEFYELTAHTYLKLKNREKACEYFMILYNITNNVKYIDIINSINGPYYKQLFEIDENYFNNNEKKKIK